MQNLSLNEINKNGYSISTDKSNLQIDVIHSFLKDSYWSPDIPKSVVEKAIRGSLCFGVYHKQKQVGFARLVTDFATFAYLADVFILEEHRGQGLSQCLMQKIINHKELQTIRRWMLATRDAHDLYKKFDFKGLAHPDVFMERHNPDIYNVNNA